MSKTAEHRGWYHMLSRCRNPNNKSFSYYGGRGITVCERWQTFENFLADMGPRPTPKHTIERIDNDGNYEPSNCRWATRLEQARNQRPTLRAAWNGETLSLWEWSEKLNCSFNIMKTMIIKHSMTIGQAIRWLSEGGLKIFSRRRARALGII